MGFFPSATLVISAGLTREDWKTLCFQQGKGLLPTAILKPRELAQLLVPESKGRLLDSIARQELLRQSFRDSNVKDALPGLREHRFRPRFYEILDRSLQQGRLRFAHQEEASVFQSVLEEKAGHNIKREEYFLLNRLWDRLLEVRELWDEPRLFSEATARLDNWQAPRALQKIYYVQHFADPPRVQTFWQRLAQRVQLEVRPAQELTTEPIRLERMLAHSIEDAALFLMDEIQNDRALDEVAVVIEDRPVVRRTLRRIAEQRGIPLQDARDPMQVSVDEELKTALLEFEIVAKGFPLDRLLEWVRLTRAPVGDREQIRTRLLEKGMEVAIKNEPAFAKAVEELRARFPGRMTLSQIHAELARTCALASFSTRTLVSIDRLFQDWTGALEPLGTAHRKQPIRFWFDQIQDRLQKAPPQVEPYRHRRGLRIFRVDQGVNLHLVPASTRVLFFGVSGNYFDPALKGEEWFTPADLETLANEFQIPSRRDQQEQNLKSYRAWAQVSRGRAPLSYEWSYNENGGECEPVDLGLSLVPGLQWEAPLARGAHPLNLMSLQSTRLKVEPTVTSGLPKTEWPISFVNAYGNCPFTAFAGYILELEDEEDPDYDLRPTDLGMLIHNALEILIVSEIKQEPVTPADAFDRAWTARRPVGWLRSERLYHAIRANVIELLTDFLASEAEYRARSGAAPLEVEYGFEMDFGGLKLKGRADRIDQHDDGLILIDYKTSSTVVTGGKALETGKGLQLPIYALGLRQKMKQEMIGATYLQLASRKIARNSGVYFQKWNKGKKADTAEKPISTLRGNSQSLFAEEPETVWGRFEALIRDRVEKIKKGDFSANPADPADCGSCRFQPVCGVTRRGASVADVTEE